MALDPRSSSRKTQKDDLTREQPRQSFQVAKAWRHLSISKAAAVTGQNGGQGRAEMWPQLEPWQILLLSSPADLPDCGRYWAKSLFPFNLRIILGHRFYIILTFLPEEPQLRKCSFPKPGSKWACQNMNLCPFDTKYVVPSPTHALASDCNPTRDSFQVPRR